MDLKIFFTSILLIIFINPIFSQYQKGIVLEQNSSNRPVPGVEISIKGFSPTVSGADGRFSVNITNVKPGSNLDVHVYKANYLVVNQKEVDLWAFAPSNTLKIIVAAKDKFNERYSHYYNMGSDHYKKLYLQKIEQIKNANQAGELSDSLLKQKISKFTKDYENATERLKVLADYFCRINIDEMHGVDSSAMEYVNHGMLDDAITAYEDSKLYDIFQTQLLEFHKTNTDIISCISSLKNFARICLFAGGDDNFIKAKQIFELLINADRTDIELLIAAGDVNSYYLSNYNKALEYYRTALLIAKSRNDYSNIISAYCLCCNSCVRAHNIQGSICYKDSIEELCKNPEQLSNSDLSFAYKTFSEVYQLIGLYDKELVSIRKCIQYGSLDDSEKAGQYISLASAFNNNVQYDSALVYSFKGLNLLSKEQASPSVNKLLSISYNNIGNAYEHLKEHDSAFWYMNKAVMLEKKVNFFGNSNLISGYNSLSTISTNMGDWSKAVLYADSALTLLKEHPSSSESTMINTYNNLGAAYMKFDLNKSFDYLNVGIEIAEKYHSEPHVELLELYHNIGECYYISNNPEKASYYFLKAYEISKQIQGAYFIGNDFTLYLYDLIVSLCDLNEYSKGHEIVDSELNRIKSQRPCRADKIASCLSYRALLYLRSNNYPAAINDYSTALLILDSINSQDNELKALCIANLAESYLLLQDFDNALELYDSAITLYQAIQGPYGDDVAGMLMMKGCAFFQKKDYNTAIDFLKESLEIKTKIYGPINKDNITSLNLLGYSYQQIGEQNLSISCYKTILDIYNALDIRIRDDKIYLYDIVADYYYRTLFDVDSAYLYYNKAYSIRKANDFNNIQTCELALLLSNICLDTKDFYAAIHYSDDAAKILAVPNQIHNTKFSTFQYKAKLFESYYYKALALDSLSKPNEAINYYKKALDLATGCYKHMQYVCLDRMAFLNESIGRLDMAIECINNRINISKKDSVERLFLPGLYYQLSILYNKSGDISNQLYTFQKGFDLEIDYLIEEPEEFERTVTFLYGLYYSLPHDQDFNKKHQKSFKEFMSHTVIEASIINEPCAAKEHGLFGKYIVFEYADWNMVLTDKDFYLFVDQYQGKPKTVSLYRDENIQKIRFESQIGAYFNVKWVSTSEKRMMINKYKQNR